MERSEDRRDARAEPGSAPSEGQPDRRSAADLVEKELVQGRLPGTRYVRIVRPHAREFRRAAPGYLIATERVLEPAGPVGRAYDALRRLFVGERLPSSREIQERVGKLKGLAVFASDNISSSAYATEETMRPLLLAGAAALALTTPTTVAIVLVLAIVVASYRQVIRAYPNGGGSYVVAHENLGPVPGLVAAAALLTEYTLTVAVSVSAGTAAIASAFPELFEQRVLISVAVVTVMTIVNLRGIRESANVLAAPTYVYLAAIFGLLGFGFARAATGTLPDYAPPPEWLAAHAAEPLTLLLVLRAFASGSVALTGTEAVSNGVPAFKPPEARNAQVVLVAMGTFFGSIFLGMSVLATLIGIVPDPEERETVVSQLARLLAGGGSPYYLLVQLSTAVLLLLAANTAFNGFPRLASILAIDRYLPRQFQFRGNRLAYTTGIVSLALVSSFLIVAFGGSVTGLIPLYTVGVFVAFTLSQAGLVRHWARSGERRWRERAALNAVGAAATGLVAVVVTASKFERGAWMVIVLIPILVGLMWATNRHYVEVEDALLLDRPDEPLPPPEPPDVIVPVRRLDRAALKALAYARSISPQVTAVHVSDDRGAAERLRHRWRLWGGDIPLVVIESPYRALVPPLLAYVEAKHEQHPERPITVVLTEFVPRHLWEWLLHNQTALVLKLRLFFRPNTVVIDVPYHSGEAEEDLGPGAEAAVSGSLRAR